MFSELVDAVARKAGRGDSKLASITDYANSTIRELTVLAYFARDLVEDTVVVDAEPFIWTRPRHLRTLRTAMLPASVDLNIPESIYLRFLLPGKVQLLENYFYYGGPGYYVFRGGPLGATLAVSYYQYWPRYRYYAVGARPAVYDYETGVWEYLLDGAYVATLGSAELDEAARAKVSNWMLEDWPLLVEMGTLNKVWLEIKDRERASQTYSVYKSQQSDLLAGEAKESLDA